MAPSTGLPSRARRYGTWATGALAAGAVAYVGLVDPHRPGSLFPPCPFKMLTGWNCPACGGLRMTHDILHGDLAAAVVDNVFLLVGLPLLAAWVIWRMTNRQPGLGRPALVVIAVSTLAWTVLRNLPGFPLVPTILSQ